MRVIHLLLTAYFVIFSIQGAKVSSRTRGYRNGKKSVPWRLRLLRRITQQLKPDIQLLSLRKSQHKNYFSTDNLGEIVEEENDSIGHVPRIQCPRKEDSERLACPTPDRNGIIYCLDDRELCDRKIQCPNGEDEDLTMCMFHKWAGSLFKRLTKGIQDLQDKLHKLDYKYRQFRI